MTEQLVVFGDLTNDYCDFLTLLELFFMAAFSRLGYRCEKDDN